MITKFKIFEKKNFDIGDVIVSIVDEKPYLRKGHKYEFVGYYGNRPVLSWCMPGGKVVRVKDIVNNEEKQAFDFQFVSIYEWEMPEINKYNL